MTPMRKISAALMALAIITTGMMIPSQSARSQGKNDPVRQQTQISKTRLEVMEGSGEFKQWVKTITISSAEKLQFAWYTDEPDVASAEWMVSNKAFSAPPWTSPTQAPNVIASGALTQVPQKGHGATFLIDFAKFAPKTPPKNSTSYWVYVVTKNAQQHPVGAPSAAVVVTQKQAAVISETFGPAVVFPSVEIVTYDEKIGIVPLTQLHFAGADVTLRVKNKGKTATDPISLDVTDNNALMRSAGAASVPSLKPGASQLVNMHLNAILPPPKSQLPEEQQHSEWRRQYMDRCGVDLRASMSSQSPMGHSETLLAQEGWADYAKGAPNTPICDGKQCVRPCQIAKNIHKELDGHAVGYSFFVGQDPKFYSYGQARTSANGPAINFMSKTKITVASVSKMVTAIAAVRILDKNNVSLDATIGPYLPSDWSPGNYVKNITFAQLLSHTSGIKDYGNVTQDYAQLKKFFTQPVSASASTMCQPSDVINPSNPINPNNLSGCYSNYNFAIFRILLPKVAGFPEDSNQLTRPLTLANQYVKLVQQNVFDLVGQKGVACKPPTESPGAFTYSFAYNYPGTHAGYDWGDLSLQCGAAGWYLSVEDIVKVLLSINAKDGKILAETPSKNQFDIMRTRRLGWDVASNTELEKNGGFGHGCDSNGNHCGKISTSIAIFGPVTGPRVIGVLFINSDISGGPSAGKGAKEVLEKAYTNALFPK
ncbi:MAG TPA: serine hydrolase domain-containing protein [Blastocatellia bacterium]|nr:serine hydrolase domain-containing protein [Blastocatellia bacterium]